MADELLTKQVTAINDIATSEHCGKRKVQKYLSLTMLSPKIIEDIMNYKNPKNFTLTKLMDMSQSVENFSEQEKLWYLKNII